jgi:hypothetical protein
MKNFNRIINKYADTKRILGKADSGLSNEQIENLRKDLLSISSKNKIYFLICVGMVVLAFLISLFLIIYYIKKPEKIQIVFSITGLSVMGLIIYMNKLWKDKVNSDMLLVLVGTLKKEMITTILVALIKKKKSNKQK